MSKFVERTHYGEHQVAIYETEVSHAVGRLAEKLLDHFTIIAAVPDGEDTSGRSKLRLMTPREAVQRACDTAELFEKELRVRHWLLALPDLKSNVKVVD